MRILILSWEFPPYVVGGMGKHVAELVPELGGLPTSRGPLYIDVVTTRYAGGEPVEQLNRYTTIHRVETPPLAPLDLYNSVVTSNGPLIEYALTLGKTHHYDGVQTHDWLTAEAGIALKHAWKAPLISTIHATERGRYRSHIADETSYHIDRMEWRACHESWRTIVCSNFMVGELHNFFGTPRDKIDMIPNGIDTRHIVPCPADVLSEMRQLYAPNGERLLFFVGRIVYEKGLQVLLQAMPMILDRDPNTRLLVAGKNAHEMLPVARELGIESAVSFLGFVSNQRRDCLYQIVDAAIFPSLYEPFGIVALEAMALGCNVIASDVGGLSEVVRHLQTGLTSYAGDPKSIAWAVDYLFRHETQAAQWRKWAQYEVRTRYNWQGIARRTAEVFAEIANERDDTDW
jgi:glycogen(starch) synthase